VVSDLDRGRVVEVLDGRNRRTVDRYLRSLPERDGLAIEVGSIDPYEAYRQAIRSALPEARIVVDQLGGPGQTVARVQGGYQSETVGGYPR
jgi:transposase